MKGRVLEPRPARVAAWAVVVSAPALVVLVMGFARRWTSDDAFIAFRVVSNLLAGHGYVFNPGERVECGTCPLWMLLLALAGLPFRLAGHDAPLEWIAAGAGLAASTWGVLAMGLAARERLRREAPGEGDGVVLPLGAIAFAALPPVWDFATSGLESGLSFAWLGSCALALARLREGRRVGAPVAMLLGAGPLIRPDFALFTLAFLGLAAILADGRRERFRVASVGLLPVVAFQLFRMGYFAALAPGPALAKEAGLAWWSQGLAYFRDLVDPYLLGVPLVALAFWWLGEARRPGPPLPRAVALAPSGAALLHGLYICRVGGDFMHGRLLLPALFVLLQPFAVPWPRSWRRAILPAPVLLWAVIGAVSLRVPYDEVGPAGVADERRFYANLARKANPVTLADYSAVEDVSDGLALRSLASTVPEPALIVGNREVGRSRVALAAWVPARLVVPSTGIGLLGYASGPRVWVVDRRGLADPLAARMLLPPGARRRPGHEKRLSDGWIVARLGGPGARVPGAPADDARLALARQALGCGDLAELLRAVTEPLTVRRFARNVLLAPGLWTFRVPERPDEAVRRLCGGPSRG